MWFQVDGVGWRRFQLNGLCRQQTVAVEADGARFFFMASVIRMAMPRAGCEGNELHKERDRPDENYQCSGPRATGGLSHHSLTYSRLIASALVK
jgi:hypothetical protein